MVYITITTFGKFVGNMMKKVHEKNVFDEVFFYIKFRPIYGVYHYYNLWQICKEHDEEGA